MTTWTRRHRAGGAPAIALGLLLGACGSPGTDDERDAEDATTTAQAAPGDPATVVPVPVPAETTVAPGAPEAVPAESDVYLSREEIPGDPSDPEPIESTGADSWDLITSDDPSTFVCVAAAGTGAEQMLTPDKEGYEAVDDAHRFVARFSDGTSVAIVVHPEVGDADAAAAEAQRYLEPLGRLPTVLRQSIGRLAIRSGDDSATASFGEGISVQTGNMDVRFADARAEETLFHESVHTALDETWAYQRSQAWLNAQAADGRWVSTYGRQNPDAEDLAESALYAYAVVFHPDLFPDHAVATIEDRIPNRIALLRTVFTEPLHAGPVTPTPTCDT